MAPLEIEVKFYLQDANDLRKRLEPCDAIYVSKVMETNIRFENQDETLYRQKSLLRLRKADKTTLTFKSEPEKSNLDFKIHNEIEVIVDDFNKMRAILEAVGFHEAQIYEKIRETWMIEKTILCLDTMPYGRFLEIEGTPEKIRNISQCLGFEWKHRILDNYLKIFEIIKKKEGFSFSDVTFENFKNVEIDFKEYLHLFMAG